MTNLDSILKSRDITLLTKVCLVKAMVFPVICFHALEKEMATHSSVLAWRIPGTGEPGGLPSMGLHRVGHDWSNLAAAAAAVCMWELEHKENRAAKNWCFWTVVLEKTLESPLDCKEVQPVNPKGNQSWIFIGRTDAEAPILWPPDMKNWLLGKDPDAGKEWRQEKKGMMANEMVGWHHRFNGREFKQALGVGDGQGSLACCSPWYCKESDTTEWLNWTELIYKPSNTQGHQKPREARRGA